MYELSFAGQVSWPMHTHVTLSRPTELPLLGDLGPKVAFFS